MSEASSITELPGKVIGCLRNGSVTILVGYGIGLMDGGVPTEVDVALVPPESRLPNSRVLVTVGAGGVISVAAGNPR